MALAERHAYAARTLLSDDAILTGDGLSPEQVALLAAYVTVTLLVCLLACIDPTWRPISIQPTEALRTE